MRQCYSKQPSIIMYMLKAFSGKRTEILSRNTWVSENTFLKVSLLCQSSSYEAHEKLLSPCYPVFSFYSQFLSGLATLTSVVIV